MVDISLMIEGQNGLTWAHWKRLVAEVEALGFAGLFRSDHFTNARPPDKESLEMIVSLAYLADHTKRIHFGPLVSPLSFRDPVFLARQALAIDDLSEGRLLLGLGAGWQEREHTLFGYALNDIAPRMARFEEGLEVISRLMRSSEPVSYSGRFFKLEGATLLPRPQRPGGPPILIGGNGPKRTLPLVARYATVWNGMGLTPEAFRERSAHLDTLLKDEGRRPEEVKRTLMLILLFAHDNDELDRRMPWRRNDPALAELPFEQAVTRIAASGRALVGNAEQIAAQIATYEQAGVNELMLQWFDLDDIAGLRHFAEGVLPRAQG